MMTNPLLELRGVNKSFGGFQVLCNINLTINQKEVCCVIGPNGAGKSTLFKLITGFLKQDLGSIHFQKHLLDRLPPFKRHQLGIAQAFQTSRAIRHLTVRDNLLLALNPYGHSFSNAWKSGYPKHSHEKVESLLNALGLASLGRISAGQLSHAHLKKLELGSALIRSPQLLLLDEPTAGLSPSETSEIASLINFYKDEMSIVIVEHDMAFVRAIDQKVFILNEGQVIREGKIDDLEKDPLVQEIYFGHRHKETDS